MTGYSTGAAQNAERRLASQDIVNSKYGKAILDGPVDLSRRLACTESFKLFCEVYGTAAFTLAWSPYHLEAIEKIEDSVKNSGCYALAMPRGSGKSTLCHWALIWALFCGHSNYVIYVGATAGASATRLSSIKTTLRFNDLLMEDFPEICGPIRACQGEARRAGGQKFAGESTEIRWGSDKLLMPTLHEFAEKAKWYNDVPFNFGGVLDFASIDGNIRGRSLELPSGKILRPQIAVVDDPQTRESASSPVQVDKREATLKGDIGYLGGPDRQCGVIVPTTVIYEDDLSHRLLNHENNPEFRGTCSSMLPSMPGHGLPVAQKEKIEAMWAVDYDEKRRFDHLNGTTHSTEYYEDNFEEMNLGAVASWPERFSESKGEISAIQSAMNLFLTDELSFYCEAQNSPMPLVTSDRIPLTIADVYGRAINVPRNLAPADHDFITAFIDVSRNVLWYTLVSFKKDTFKGHILDYGVFPDQGRPYVTLASCKRTIPEAYPEAEYSVALTKALDSLTIELATRVYKTEGGQAINIEKIGIDAGWGEEAQTVYNFCRRSTLKHILVSTKGFGSTPLKRPLVDPEKKREPRSDLLGQWKFSRNTVGNNLLSYDTNLWKSKVNTLLRMPVESKSGMTIFGAKENGRSPDHRMFAEQNISEKAMLVEGGGRRIETWKNPPGKDNHLFDCLVGCTMLASVNGGKMQFSSAALSAISGSQSTKKARKRKRYVKKD
jgi:hypothetical protein